MTVTNTHACPGGCGKQIPQQRLSCQLDWYRLPRELRDEINAAYRNRGRNRLAHVRALQKAYAWYHGNPRIDTLKS